MIEETDVKGDLSGRFVRNLIPVEKAEYIEDAN
jgi:hypothetical protein